MDHYHKTQVRHDIQHRLVQAVWAATVVPGVPPIGVDPLIFASWRIGRAILDHIPISNTGQRLRRHAGISFDFPMAYWDWTGQRMSRTTFLRHIGLARRFPRACDIPRNIELSALRNPLERIENEKNNQYPPVRGWCPPGQVLLIAATQWYMNRRGRGHHVILPLPSPDEPFIHCILGIDEPNKAARAFVWGIRSEINGIITTTLNHWVQRSLSTKGYSNIFIDVVLFNNESLDEALRHRGEQPFILFDHRSKSPSQNLPTQDTGTPEPPAPNVDIPADHIIPVEAFRVMREPNLPDYVRGTPAPERKIPDADEVSSPRPLRSMSCSARIPRPRGWNPRTKTRNRSCSGNNVIDPLISPEARRPPC